MSRRGVRMWRSGGSRCASRRACGGGGSTRRRGPPSVGAGGGAVGGHRWAIAVKTQIQLPGTLPIVLNCEHAYSNQKGL